MTTFQEKFDNGILSKTHFQKSDITQSFIKWLIPFIDGKRNLSEIGLQYNGKYKNFNEAIEKYQWGKGELKDLSFKNTFDRFDEWGKKLNAKNSTNEELLNTCVEILKWGGGAKLLNSNKTKLEKENLRIFFTKMNNIFEGDELTEIKVSDLNPNYISSGFTKIYAALNENFIMYDGRVGAALCYLVRFYLQENNLLELPDELSFGYGLAMGKQNRNPNSNTNKTIQFKEISSHRNIHFISNIKANWLLEFIAKDTTVKITQTKEGTEKIFALQTALFVLGYDIPTVN